MIDRAFLIPALALSGFAQTASRHFDFGSGPAAPGHIRVAEGDGYSAARGHGIDFGFPVACPDRGGPDALAGDLCAAKGSWYFSVALPEGAYRVSVAFGDPAAAAIAVVKAESRRLMLEGVRVAAGSRLTRSFTVECRRPALANGSMVGLSGLEKASLGWDDKLTLEFAGEWAAVASLDIEPASAPMQVFLAGNSTVCDWENETETSWGQMFPRWLGPGTLVSNLAKSGLTAGGFISERRLAKALGRMRAGDRMLIEFGHNDMKGAVPGAMAEYRANLAKLADSVRAHGGVPLFVTCTARRSFDAKAKAINTFTTAEGDYVAAMKTLAASKDIPIVDLNSMSTRFIEALGPEGSKAAYYTNDNTHWNDYGAYTLARCVAQGLRALDPALAAHIEADSGFDPSRPDPPASFSLPLSPDVSLRKPVALPRVALPLPAIHPPGVKPPINALGRRLPEAPNYP